MPDKLQDRSWPNKSHIRDDGALNPADAKWRRRRTAAVARWGRQCRECPVLACWVEISASSALNKVDRQGDEGIYCLLTQQNGVTWRQYLGRWMTDMDRSGGDG